MIGVIGTVADSGDISPISTRTLAKAICTGLSAQDNDS
jgi:hypothetical protein